MAPVDNEMTLTEKEIATTIGLHVLRIMALEKENERLRTAASAKSEAKKPEEKKRALSRRSSL